MNDTLPETIDYQNILLIVLKKVQLHFDSPLQRVFATLHSHIVMKFSNSQLRFDAKITLNSKLRYQNGKFYLSKLRIHKIDIKGVNPLYANIANTSLSQALQDYFAKNPIYTLDSAQKKSLKLRISSLKFKNNELVIGFRR